VKNLNGRSNVVKRLILKIPDNIKLKYKPGKDNANADYLSRIIVNSIVVEHVNWPLEQDRDPSIFNAKNLVANKSNLPIVNLERIWSIEHDVLKVNGRIIVPKHMINRVLVECHDNYCHFGLYRVYEQCKSKYYWPNMQQDISNHIQNCIACQKFKPKLSTKAPIKSIVSNRPFQTVLIDITGPLPSTRNRKPYIIAAIDHYGKWVELDSIYHQDEETTTKFITDKIIFRYGPTDIILTDKGKNLIFKKKNYELVLLRTLLKV
jgi:hypothetical protein